MIKLENYENIFGKSNNAKHYFSPGRVNLIGEHIDYNGGFVFPAAISIGTYAIAEKRNDRKIRLFSGNFTNQNIIEVSLDQLEFKKSHGWANYAKGIVAYLVNQSYDIHHGFNIYIKGDLPTASGLSSSASLEVLVAYICNDIYHLNLSRVELALLAQKVENEYMGMHCGIMDQLIIASGIEKHALLMNTATLEMKPYHASFEGYQLIIMNTNYQRKTTDSKYNERVNECQQALKIIKKRYDINYLCELSTNDLKDVKEMINNDILYKRVKHAVTEQQRTLDAMIAMKTQDIKVFGEILYASHQSLKEDYEVTGIHLDTLVDAAKQNDAIGARVTGAGFGGCAIAFVKNENVEAFKKGVSMSYNDKTGLNVSFYEVDFVDGVGEINNGG